MAEVDDVIDIVLSRYGHHKSVIGANVDMEWKLTGLLITSAIKNVTCG